MNIRSRNGFALVLALILVIILSIAGISLYFAAEHIVTETKVKQVQYIRGYYRNIAALRYATILLRDPDAVFDGGTPAINEAARFSLNGGHDFTLDITATPVVVWTDVTPVTAPWVGYQAFAGDIGLDINHDVTLIITAIDDTMGGVEFRVSASYTY